MPILAPAARHREDAVVPVRPVATSTPARGRPVMFLPGFGMRDDAMYSLAAPIAAQGHAVYGWGQGRNLGLSVRVLGNVVALLGRIHARHASPVSLVGWSAGGLYAREIARRHPDRVGHVFTLGSPIRAAAQGAPMVPAWLEWLTRLRERLGEPGFVPDLQAPAIPTTAIFSRADAVVPWPAAMEIEGPCTENVEVDGGHLSLGSSPRVLQLIATRLAAVSDAGPARP